MFIGAQAFGVEFNQETENMVVLSYVRCLGTEMTLMSCPSSRPYSSYGFNHSAGVRCQLLGKS